MFRLFAEPPSLIKIGAAQQNLPGLLGLFRAKATSLKGANDGGPARGCLAGLISWKLGGGIFSTIIIFLIVFWLLGHLHC